MKIHHIAVTIGLLACSSLAAQATTTLLDDTFSTGATRTNRQNLSTSASWYGSGTSNVTLDNTAGTLTVTKGNIITGYFTGSGAPTTLGAGETLTVSVIFKVDTSYNSSNSIRLGLYNSNGTRLTTDGGAFSNNLYTDDTGYAVFSNPGAANIALASRVPPGAGDGYITGGTGTGPTTYSTTLATGSALSANTNYALTLSVTRSLDGLSSILSTTLNGITTSYTDSTNAYSSFDSIVLLYNPGTNGSYMTIDEISVLYNAVPESSSMTMMLGGLALMVIMVKRRFGSCTLKPVSGR